MARSKYANRGHVELTDRATKQPAPRAAAVIRVLASDVAALQEVDDGCARTGGVDQARRLRSWRFRLPRVLASDLLYDLSFVARLVGAGEGSLARDPAPPCYHAGDRQG